MPGPDTTDNRDVNSWKGDAIIADALQRDNN